MRFESAKKQDEAVRDLEKAHRMAEAENPEREFLSEFKAYIKDPPAYQAQERERIARLLEDNTYTSNRAEDFMYLCQEGVHVNDLERLANLAGETEGGLYELEQTLKGTSPLIIRAFDVYLRILERWNWKALERAQLKEGNKIDIMGSEKGVVVEDTLRKLGVHDDEESERQNNLYLRLNLIFTMREKVREVMEYGGSEQVAA